MPRNAADLAGTRYDLLVVGGGIHGLFAAYDAASRGLSVALVERADFGGGLSAQHQRTLHGGLRAMESASAGKARGQIRERRTWAVIAPHLIRPLPFLIGTYRFTKRSRWLVKAGFKAYDFIGRHRNHDVSPELHLPRAKLESAAATRRLFPGIAEKGLSGGAVWYDYQIKHPDRLNWTVVLAAVEAGAKLANYIEATGPLRDGQRIAGARVRDLVTGREHDLQASATLLACGGGLPSTMAKFGVTGAPPMVRAMNLLVNRPARDIATAARGSSGRMLTMVPWQGLVLVGTFQSPEVIADLSAPAPDMIDACLADANIAFPKLNATRGDIRLVHCGLTPAMVRNGKAELLPEPQVISHAREGTAGVHSLVGVKFTTARRAAEHAIDAVCKELGRARGRCITARKTLPHAGIADFEGRLVETLREVAAELDRDVMDHFGAWYGTEASTVIQFARTAGLTDRLAPGCAILAGEVAYAVEFGAAVHLSDVVLRRLPLGNAGHPGQEALTRAADIMGERMNWSPERRAEEIAAVERIYP